MAKIRPGDIVLILESGYTQFQGVAGQTGRVVKLYPGEYPLSVETQDRCLPLKLHEVQVTQQRQRYGR
jgi:hypothetical protein